MISLEDEILDKFEARKIKKIFAENVDHNYEVYLLDEDKKVYLKNINNPFANLIINKELSCLNEIINTQTISVPKPYNLINNSDEYYMSIEYIENLKPIKELQEKLGDQLANLHRDNYIKIKRKEKAKSWIKDQPDAIEEFGYEEDNVSFLLLLDNTWNKNWIEFFARNRLEPQIKSLLEKRSDRPLIEEWSKFQLKLDKLFIDDEYDQIKIYPALLHGDLLIKNIKEADDKLYLLRPNSFYGHSEYDLAIANIDNEFGNLFYETYFKKIKKQNGFEARVSLYKLFHFLSFWENIDISYRKPSIDILKTLNNSLYKS